MNACLRGNSIDYAEMPKSKTTNDNLCKTLQCFNFGFFIINEGNGNNEKQMIIKRIQLFDLANVSSLARFRTITPEKIMLIQGYRQIFI